MIIISSHESMKNGSEQDLIHEYVLIADQPSDTSGTTTMA